MFSGRVLLLSYSPVRRCERENMSASKSVNTYAPFLASGSGAPAEPSRNCLQNRGRTCMFCGS